MKKNIAPKDLFKNFDGLTIAFIDIIKNANGSKTFKMMACPNKNPKTAKGCKILSFKIPSYEKPPTH